MDWLIILDFRWFYKELVALGYFRFSMGEYAAVNKKSYICDQNIINSLKDYIL